jgi:hypothetical protein
MEQKRNADRLLMGRPNGKGAIGRPRRRLMANIKIHLTVI